MADPRSLRQGWEAEAENWVRWAREPGLDSYWRFHRDAFFSLIPAPGHLTLDIGCGEGRVARDLKAMGHRVVALDASATMVRFAIEADSSIDTRVADAADLPIADGAADLAVSFMSLQDTDDMAGAVREASRVLIPTGVYCLAIVHPINSAGRFVGRDPDSPFLIEGDYYAARARTERVEREGLSLTFHQQHRPLEQYTQALAEAGFVIEALRECRVDEASVQARGDRARWRRMPLFLDLRARKI